jgi:hypothetical protein
MLSTPGKQGSSPMGAQKLLPGSGGGLKPVNSPGLLGADNPRGGGMSRSPESRGLARLDAMMPQFVAGSMDRNEVSRAI